MKSPQLIELIELSTGESLIGRDNSQSGSIKLVMTQYEDRDAKLLQLLKNMDTQGLAEYCTKPADYLLIGSEIDAASGHPVRYVQWWAKVEAVA